MLLQTLWAIQSRTNTIPCPALGAFGGMEAKGSQMSLGPSEEIFGEGEPAEYMYKVINGAMRTYKILCDGRHQIGGFPLPGGIFGPEIAKEPQFSVEVIKDLTVLVVRRSAIVSLGERDYDAARELWSLTGREPNRVQEHCCFSKRPPARCVLPAGNVLSARRHRYLRPSNVARGYCRLSRADDRDHVAHHDAMASEQTIELLTVRDIVLPDPAHCAN
jgi:hypothetical protein